MAAFLMLLEAWVLVAFTQSELGGYPYQTPVALGIEGLLNVLGYIILPSTLALALFLAYAYSNDVLRLVLKRRSYVVVLTVAALLYGVLYGYSAGMIQLVSMPQGSSDPFPAFATFSNAFGPLALWPDIGYGLPSAGVIGFVSIGTGMLLIVLSLLMGLNASLFCAKITGRRRRVCGTTATAGALVSTMATSFCCSSPLIFPLLIFFASYGLANYVIAQLDPVSPLFNLIIVLNLSLLVAGTYSLATRTRLGSCPALSEQLPPGAGERNSLSCKARDRSRSNHRIFHGSAQQKLLIRRVD